MGAVIRWIGESGRKRSEKVVYIETITAELLNSSHDRTITKISALLDICS